MPSGGIESVDFVITDFKLQISSKSLVNISKSFCLKTFKQTPQQPFCQGGEGRPALSIVDKGYFWNKNRNLQHILVSVFF